jgi:hypothetical protein
MATVSYWMYEQPFLKLKNRFRRPESPKADDHAEPATTVGSPESVILSEAKNLAGARA